MMRGWMSLLSSQRSIWPRSAFCRVGRNPPDTGCRYAEVFEVPLAFLLDPANHQRHSMHYRGVLRHFFAMPYGEYFIWGATAGMIRSLSERLDLQAA